MYAETPPSLLVNTFAGVRILSFEIAFFESWTDGKFPVFSPYRTSELSIYYNCNNYIAVMAMLSAANIDQVMVSIYTDTEPFHFNQIPLYSY